MSVNLNKMTIGLPKFYIYMDGYHFSI